MYPTPEWGKKKLSKVLMTVIISTSVSRTCFKDNTLERFIWMYKTVLDMLKKFEKQCISWLKCVKLVT